MNVFKKFAAMTLASAVVLGTLAGCGSSGGDTAAPAGSGAAPAATGGAAKDITEISVGVSLGTLKQERWAREAEMFQQYADDNGFSIDIQSANDDNSLQVSQCENMINKGIDVLLLQALDASAVSPIIEEAHDAGIKVISYDRFCMNCDLDYYITFDSVKVGEVEAQFVVDAAPKGNYIVLRGGPEDNNARLVAEGQDNVLNPLIEKGDIKVITDQWCDGWDPNVALEHTENGLTACNNDVQGLIASNDGTCGGAIQALAEQGLDGKVPTCGQDADLAACQRIVEGTQTGTVFKPTVLLNKAACQLAVACATGAEDEKGAIDSELGVWTTLNNDQKDVDSFSVDVIPVTADNMYDIICKEYEYHSVEDVYANVPKDQWPE